MDFVELLKQNALPASECIDDEIVLPINVAIDILKEQRSTNENNLSSIVLTTQEILTLLQVASKLCENKEKVIGALFPDEMLMQQMRAAIKEAVRVLGRVDRDYPGMVPVPHDGKTWKERLFNEDN